MKILYVITGLGLGGAEKVVCDLADQMAGKGHEVKIAYLTGDKVISPQSPNIEIIYLGLNGIKSFVSASFKYRQLLKKFRPDIVHAHMVHANIFTRLNRVINHIPKLICTAHNSNEGGKLRMFAYHYTNFLSDKNTNVSKEATQSLINKGAFNQSNVITVYNGIDIDKFSKLSGYKQDRETIRFISIGRFNEQKDYPNLLNAITKISSKKNLSFDIVGDGELRPFIEDLILSLDIGDKVKLLGRRSDIPNLLNNSDFFILPSAYEGFGLVVAEAMACGAFVIATNSGGVAEVMGDTGILVPPQDSQALATAIQKALSLSDEEIAQNNIKARKRIEKLFSLEKSVEKWLEIYEQ